ncbi:hypothetical protein [Rhizocola hellebori]|uniref:hypothetical protein n=1 Tax=Rhizocola hellebori TaxID=1392758 RepID=UPI001945885F|nr:hypothetical protein [Rhizocola hellebori]
MLYHGYQIRLGEVVVEVAGTLAVPRDDLRNAVAKVRPSGTLFTTDIPGYQARVQGIPPGTMLEAGGQGNGHLDVLISMQGMSMYDDYLCVPMQECEREEADLTYWREATSHGYVHRRGKTGVYIRGGLSVDRALLRETVLSARQMTDSEVLQAFPSAPLAPGLANWIRSVLPDR